MEESALDAISRMAMGGMRDAQSILDQMISFCGNTITQQNVLEVYGLVSSDRITLLADGIIRGDYGYILNETSAFSNEGLDFYRALQDLSDYFRYKLVEQLSAEGNESYPEQLVRILDALREGDELVRLGLSEKTNFEVTLFRAVESGKSRSIDQVIRKISKVLPDEENKKKTELTSGKVDKSNTGIADVAREVSEISNIQVNEVNSSGNEDPVFQEKNSSDLSENTKEVSSNLESEQLSHQQTKKADIRQIQDENEIRNRVDQLPEELRKSLVDEFKVNFVAIEKIDPKQLI